MPIVEVMFAVYRRQSLDSAVRLDGLKGGFTSRREASSPACGGLLQLGGNFG